MSEAQTITRNELYELAWTEPISKLAPRYGLSDVGLAKLCRRHDIPLPPRGYWEKLRYGKPVTKTPHPDLPKQGDQSDTIAVQATETSPEPTPPADIKAAVSQEAEDVLRLTVPENVRNHHALLVELIARTKERNNLPYGTRKRVTDADHRLWRIMTTLFNAIDKRGWIVKRDDSLNCLINLFGQSIPLRVDEKQAQRRVERSLEQNRRSPNWTYDTVYKATGTLRIRLERKRHSNVSTWLDTPSARLDEKLNSVIIGLLHEAASRRAEAIARAERERIGAEERHRAEQKRVKELIKEAEQWALATKI